MITIEELNKRKIQIVKNDNSLKKFKEMPLFEDKIKKANETLKKVRLPRLEKVQ